MHRASRGTERHCGGKVAFSVLPRMSAALCSVVDTKVLLRELTGFSPLWVFVNITQGPGNTASI